MIPATHEQIVEMEALMVEQFNIPLKEVMNTVGVRLAEFVREKFPSAHKILLFCGRGHNGGDGLAATRYLHEYGFEPTIIMLPGELKELTRHYLEVADELKIPIFSLEDYEEKIMMGKYDLVIDCLVGNRLSGSPWGDLKIGIIAVNEAREHNIPILACDIPSGIDCDEGPVFGTHVLASHTLSFAFPKKGLVGRGQIFVADVGVPQELYPIIEYPAEDYFKDGPIIRC